MDLRNFAHKVIFWKLDDIFCVIRVFQYATVFMGYGYIGDYRKERRGIWKYFRGLFFTVFWLAYFIILIQINLTTNFFATMSSSFIANVGRRLVLIFGLILGIITLITSYMVRSRITDFFKKILKFDQMCADIGIDVDLKYECFGISLFTVCALLYNVMVVAISIISHDSCQSPKLFFYMHVPLYVTSVVYLSFINLFQIVMFSVINRFNKLNDHLWLTLTSSNQPRMLTPFVKKRGGSLILIYAEMHEKLVACVEDISYCFTIPVMFATAGTFSFMITTLFVLFRTYAFGDMSMIHVSQSFFLWCVFFTLPILVNIFAGSTVKNSGAWMATVIHRGLIMCRDVQIKNDLKIFSLQLIHRIPVVSCGLFPYDWTLLYSLASAVTTYLVILIQFDSSFGNHSNSTDVVLNKCNTVH